MKHAILPATFSVALVALVAAPVLAAERTFDLAGFTEVAAGAGLEVEIVQGDGFSVAAEGAPRGLDRLEIETRGDLLVIEQRARGLERFSPLMRALNDDVVVRVSLPELVRVTASAGSDVTATGSSGKAFSAEASSGADLVVTGVDAARVALAASSGAGLEVSGQCETLTAGASSGADLDARGLRCDAAEAQGSSGAGIALSAGAVRAEASSGAAVNVWDADTVEAEESSGGSVEMHR